jgi:hypothetical protein
MVIEQRNKNDSPISSKGTSESQQEEWSLSKSIVSKHATPKDAKLYIT